MGMLEVVCTGHRRLPEPDPVGTFLFFCCDAFWGTGKVVQRPLKVKARERDIVLEGTGGGR